MLIFINDSLFQQTNKEIINVILTSWPGKVHVKLTMCFSLRQVKIEKSGKVPVKTVVKTPCIVLSELKISGFFLVVVVVVFIAVTYLFFCLFVLFFNRVVIQRLA